jgi:Cu+-exporting ATPase
LDALRADGLHVAMITGDQARTARALATELHVDDVRAEVLPSDKAAAIRDLQTQHKVVFVGDGINDAVALAQAEVGIAIGTGTDVAIESADVVLMSPELTGVTRAIRLSRAVMHNIYFSLFWAFAYNIVLIPIAAGALRVWGITLSPMLAGVAMGLSSVFVLANALRLRRVHP